MRGCLQAAARSTHLQAVALRDGQNAELGEVLDQAAKRFLRKAEKHASRAPQEYTAGFYTNIESESLPKGLNEAVIAGCVVSVGMKCECKSSLSVACRTLSEKSGRSKKSPSGCSSFA